MKYRGFCQVMILLAAMLGPVPALADVSARYEAPKREHFHFKLDMTIEVDDGGNVRTQAGEQAAYVLILDGVSYWVGKDHAGLFVVRIDDMATVFGEMSLRMGFPGNEMDPKTEAEQSKEAYVAMGSREVHGRKGIAYGMSFRGKPPEIAEYVISDDPRLAPLGQVFAKSFKLSANSLTRMLPGSSLMAGAFEPIGELFKKGAPIQIMSQELTDVSFDPIDPARFRLPAEPLTIEQLRAQYEGFAPPPNLPPRGK